jgi:hypothetical protein
MVWGGDVSAISWGSSPDEEAVRLIAVLRGQKRVLLGGGGSRVRGGWKRESGLLERGGRRLPRDRLLALVLARETQLEHGN